MSQTLIHIEHIICQINHFQVLKFSFQCLVSKFLILELDVQITVKIGSVTNLSN